VSHISDTDHTDSRTGRAFNLVAFDPRGTGKNNPISCAENDLDLLSLRDDFKLDAERSLGRLWAATEVFSERCMRTQADIMPFVGTASVARDLMRVVDAMEEDGMLRFWGQTFRSCVLLDADIC
jgi:hypothetical protein